MEILITAGPTREFFDSVRFITNASSGKMGFAVAIEAARRDHRVHLIAGPVSLPDPPGVSVTHVVTAHEMHEAAVALFDECHAAVMTAAVCDYRPATRADHKQHKEDATRQVELTPTIDICAALGHAKDRRIVVGFALQDVDRHARAEGKLRRKRCDAIVLNDVSTLAADFGTIEIFRADVGWLAPLTGDKQALARGVVDLVESLFAA